MTIDGKSKKVIVLLENEFQVKNYLEMHNGDYTEKKFVALSPFAAYELEKEVIDHNLIEDFYNESELYELGMENYAKMESICGMIDNKLKNNVFQFNMGYDISPALFNFYPLKLIYDSITIRLFQLSRLIQNELPDKLVIYRSTIYPLNTDGTSLLFDNRESLYSHLLNLTGWNVFIETLAEPKVPDFSKERKRFSLRSKVNICLKSISYNKPQFNDFLIILKNKKSGELIPFIKSIFSRNKGSVLLLDAGYNWNACTYGFKKIGLNKIYRIPTESEYWSAKHNEKIIKDVLLGVFDMLKNNLQFRHLFVHENIDFFPLLETRLRFLISHLTFVCLSAYNEAEKILVEKKIRVLLASTLSTCVQQSFAKAAISLNIPVIAWQHGNYGYYDQPMVVYKDIAPVDCLFVFGEGVRKKYEKEAKKYNSTLIPIGSTLLEQLPKGKKRVDVVKNIGDPEKKNVVFVVTNYYQNDLYITSPPPFSDNNFWKVQKSVIDIFSKYEGYNFFIKLHPSSRYREPPMRRYVKENGIENILFVKDKYTFIDLLSIADVLIIDFPSTTLLQSLTTNKPIIVYDGHDPIDKEARTLLDYRVGCYGNTEMFINVIDNYLSTGKIHDDIDLENCEFLELYGTGYNGEKATERAITELKKIINFSG